MKTTFQENEHTLAYPIGSHCIIIKQMCQPTPQAIQALISESGSAITVTVTGTGLLQLLEAQKCVTDIILAANT